MRFSAGSLRVGLLIGLLANFALAPAADSEVLASVGTSQVTSEDLTAALGSSPFSTQFNALDEDDQAGLRGDMLRRLVAARLLALEARRVGLDKTTSYRQDVADFRRGLLYRHYNESLRNRVRIPPETLTALKQQFAGDADGMAAAKAAWVADQFRSLKKTALQDLLREDRVVLHDDRIVDGVKPDTVLMESNSFRLRYADVVDLREHPSLPNPEWVKDRLYQRGEMLLFANAAERQGADVSQELLRYEAERLPALMLESKAKEWTSSEDALRQWFDRHPEVATVVERRHVGQIVTASGDEAEQLRRRIIEGESLFALAGRYSIDPVSRKQNGDMGWIVEGRGLPELDRALATLADGQVSGVIQTALGFHLLMILERQPGRRETYEQVRERVRQLVINEELRGYLGELERRYPVTWKVIRARAATATATPAQ